MPTNINCQCYKNTRCLHDKKPRSLFQRLFNINHVCNVYVSYPFGTCDLQYPHKKLDGKPLPPPPRTNRLTLIPVVIKENNK